MGSAVVWSIRIPTNKMLEKIQKGPGKAVHMNVSVGAEEHKHE
jgi:hypothetical protein